MGILMLDIFAIVFGFIQVIFWLIVMISLPLLFGWLLFVLLWCTILIFDVPSFQRS